MRLFHFECGLTVPRRRAEVFAFFADAANLQTMTPGWVDFRILTPGPIVLRAGALLDYRIRVHGIPLRWRTEITLWEPPFRFVDTQLKGPYSVWRHEHTFEETAEGTVCGDRVTYRPRGGWLIDRLFVRRDIDRIFDFRRRCLAEIFRCGA